MSEIGLGGGPFGSGPFGGGAFGGGGAPGSSTPYRGPRMAIDAENLAGTRVAGPLPYESLRITRRLLAGMTCQFTLDGHDETALNLRQGLTVVKVYDQEDDALRFRGKIRDPFARSPGQLSIVAGSPFTLLDRRRLQEQYVATGKDQAVILEEILAAQNARGNTRLRLGPLPGATVTRDRTYEAGKSVQEIAADLSRASVEDGLWFVENPLDDELLDCYSELVFTWPESGVDRPGAKFEYGHDADDTLRNLESYSVTEQLPVNGVTGTGAGAGGDQLTSRAEDPTSILDYDLLETEVAFSDVADQAHLDELTAGQLQPAPSHTFTIKPVASSSSDVLAGLIYVPRPWADFDVGDLARLTIHDGATVYDDVPVRIVEFTVSYSDDAGAESLDTIVLETLLQAGAARDPRVEVFQVFDRTEKRLRALERPGVLAP